MYLKRKGITQVWLCDCDGHLLVRDGWSLDNESRGNLPFLAMVCPIMCSRKVLVRPHGLLCGLSVNNVTRCGSPLVV